MPVQRVNTAIIGGGCAGWWVAKELSHHKVSCVVIDEAPFGARASTRNQGWLHSGAFYLSVDKPDHEVAQACRAGYDIIRKDYPRALNDAVPCYYLFETAQECMESAQLCRESGIFARDFRLEDEDLELREPLIAGTPLRFALEVGDRPVNTNQLLHQIARDACRDGARACTVSGLGVINPVWRDDRWQIGCGDDLTVECETIVVACGAYIPDMLNNLIPGQASAFRRTKVGVLVLRGTIANAMISTPRALSGPNLVPFYDQSESGATVCLLRADKPITVPTDYALPDDSLAAHAEQLSDLYGGITALATQQAVLGTAITAYFYTCQKIELRRRLDDSRSDRSRILLSFAPKTGMPKNVVVLYPGKFTSAPVAAKECADVVRGMISAPSLGTIEYAETDYTETIPAIARQPYYDAPRYKLAVQRGGLVFEGLPQSLEA